MTRSFPYLLTSLRKSDRVLRKISTLVTMNVLYRRQPVFCTTGNNWSPNNHYSSLDILPFNFCNGALPKWPALACWLTISVQRNQKGTVLTGQINIDELVLIQKVLKTFALNKIIHIRVRQTHTDEVMLDLQDLDDRSNLSSLS